MIKTQVFQLDAKDEMDISDNIESFTPLYAQRCALSGWLAKPQIIGKLKWSQRAELNRQW